MSENKQRTNSKKKKYRKKIEKAGNNVVVESPDVVDISSMERATKELAVNKTKPIIPPAIGRVSAGSNWLQATEQNETGDERCAEDEANQENTPETGLSKSARIRQKKRKTQVDKYVAMDCEMVGVGFNGQEDMLARVSIVNKRGEVLLDKFVKPQEAVTDYRTTVSGIRPHNVENAEDFKGVQDEVIEILQGKILVGHAIRNDLAVLHIKHPFINIRDTARYKPLCRLVANGRTPSLKRLSQAILGLEIQTGEHNSIEDARAAMNIYNRLSCDWEKYLKKHQHKNLK